MIKHFLIGCCYYPEHWDDENMEYDLDRIKALGFNIIRMGEFAWSMYEPAEGQYDFSFLRKAVEYAGKIGLDVILGTPTAAPPKWLIDKYPEVLARTDEGIVMAHGSRQHHNHTSEIYLECCKKITEEMLKAFCDCKNVIGWQIDNELNCHRKESYSEADDIAFRKWLENKYGTVENLNKAWGTRFWSLEFDDFSRVECPRKTPTHMNPSLKTDYYMFLSDAAINYAYIQTEIIRKYMPDAFITHNGYFDNIDYRELTDKCLDIMSFDSYPAFRENLGKTQSRMSCYKLALTRSCSEKFIITEQQAGPGGQLSYLLPTPLPGQIRLWVYQSIAHGAMGVLYFRYRTALFGCEQLWYGIHDHDGEENYRSREIKQISEELNRVGDIFCNNLLKTEVGIYDDYQNLSCEKTECFVKNDNWEIFNSLNMNNIHADFINFNDDFSKYKVVIFPHVAIADETLSKKIEEFTQNGGVAIISARSGVKDKNAHYRPMKAPGVFRNIAGCRVDWFTALSTYDKQSVVFDNKEYKVDNYYEMLEAENGDIVGRYTEGFCKEKGAVCKNGNVYYVGFYCREADNIYVDIVKKCISAPKIINENLEEFTMGDYKLYLNYADYPVAFSGYDLIKQSDFESVEPYGVVLVNFLASEEK